VVGPSHLIQQWYSQLVRHFPSADISGASCLRAFLITERNQHVALTYREVQSAHIILVSSAFLVNGSYYATLEGKVRVSEKLPSKTEMDTRRATLKRKFIQLNLSEHWASEGRTPLDAPAPWLEHFMFRRLILDEGHEGIRMETAHTPTLLLSILLELKARTFLYVSATAFSAAHHSFRGCASFLRMELDGAPLVRALDDDHEMIDFVLPVVMDQLYCRNTKTSVGPADYQVPAAIDDVRLLDFSPIEQAMYKSKHKGYKKSTSASEIREQELRLYRRQLCCHPQLSEDDHSLYGKEARSLADIRKLLIRHKQAEIIQRRVDLNDLNDHFGVVQAESEATLAAEEKQIRALQRGMAPSAVAKWRKTHRPFEKERRLRSAQLVDIKQSISDAADDVHRLTELLQFLEGIKTVEKRECAECQMEITSETGQSLTPCGHFFCDACVKKMRASGNGDGNGDGDEGVDRVGGGGGSGSDTIKCLQCDEKMPYSQLKRVAVERTDSDGKDLQSMINCYGTKMSHLIQIVSEITKSDADARVIVFSQWNAMLERIGGTLKSAAIPHVFCKGNVRVRNASIRKFQQGLDGVRVMMLSWEKSASGTDFSNASHIILMDAIDGPSGTAHEAVEIETQALGRAIRQGQTKRVVVIRLIMRNTIEHEIHEVYVLFSCAVD
jgi:hypothetical protein